MVGWGQGRQGVFYEYLDKWQNRDSSETKVDQSQARKPRYGDEEFVFFLIASTRIELAGSRNIAVAVGGATNEPGGGANVSDYIYSDGPSIGHNSGSVSVSTTVFTYSLRIHYEYQQFT